MQGDVLALSTPSTLSTPCTTSAPHHALRTPHYRKLTPYEKIENIQALTDESIERFERGIIFINLPIHKNKEYADERI